MAATLSFVEEFYVPISGSGSQYTYTYGGGYAAGTRILFVVASAFNWASLSSPVSTDTQGNSYTAATRANPAGTVAIIQCKLGVAVTSSDTVGLLPANGREGWVQVYAATNDTGVLSVAGGDGGFALDAVTSPKSLIQSSNPTFDSYILGVMQMVDGAHPLTVVLSGGASEVANHSWSGAGGFNTATFYARSVPAGSFSYTHSVDAGENVFGWQGVQFLIVGAAPPSVRGVSHVYGSSGRLFVTRNQQLGGVLAGQWWTDALPPVLQGSVNVDTGTVDGHDLSMRRSQELAAVYGLNGAVLLRHSRNRARNWSAAVTVAASGYRNPTHCWDRSRHLLVVVMQQISSSNWYVTVGEMDAAGDVSAFSTPVLMANGSGDNAAQVTWEGDRRFTFSYVDAGGATAVIRTESLAKDGVGVWS